MKTKPKKKPQDDSVRRFIRDACNEGKEFSAKRIFLYLTHIDIDNYPRSESPCMSAVSEEDAK